MTRTPVLGVTGTGGSGKSSLTDELTLRFRLDQEDRLRIAVIAVDPSRRRTGGALLGDRIRMEERTLDTGVYIRSMASRGSHGGLSRATVDACDVMDAFGFDEIVVETVGVGQAEYDIVSAADTVLVVSAMLLMTAAFASLPYLFAGGEQLDHPIDAYLEGMSAVTTTGASVVTDYNAFSPTLAMWRQFTQWLGGMGIIILAVAILPRLRVGGRQMMESELPGPEITQLGERIRELLLARTGSTGSTAPSDPLTDFITSRQGKALQREIVRGVFGMLRKRL